MFSLLHAYYFPTELVNKLKTLQITVSQETTRDVCSVSTPVGTSASIWWKVIGVEGQSQYRSAYAWLNTWRTNSTGVLNIDYIRKAWVRILMFESVSYVLWPSATTHLQHLLMLSLNHWDFRTEYTEFDNDYAKTATFFIGHWFGDMIVPRRS